MKILLVVLVCLATVTYTVPSLAEATHQDSPAYGDRAAAASATSPNMVGTWDATYTSAYWGAPSSGDGKGFSTGSLVITFAKQNGPLFYGTLTEGSKVRGLTGLVSGTVTSGTVLITMSDAVLTGTYKTSNGKLQATLSIQSGNKYWNNNIHMPAPPTCPQLSGVPAGQQPSLLWKCISDLRTQLVSLYNNLAYGTGQLEDYTETGSMTMTKR